MTKEERRGALKDICRIVKVEGIDAFKVISSLDNEDFVDFEDCLQEECAVAVSADYIVTRNTKDFTSSRIPAILPDKFLERTLYTGRVGNPSIYAGCQACHFLPSSHHQLYSCFVRISMVMPLKYTHWNQLRRQSVIRAAYHR